MVELWHTVECDDDTESNEDGSDYDCDGWQLDKGMPVRDFFAADIVAGSGVHVFDDFFHCFLLR